MGKKRIGILTSGGDCPGLNFAIRAVVSHATITYDYEVLGIPYATQGLLERKAIALPSYCLSYLHGIDPLLCIGGTILGSLSKGDTLDRAEEIIAGYFDLALDAVIAIGGDGSMAILRELAQRGNWNLVMIPKTIDNDVALTRQSLGFNSAVTTVTESLERLSFTAASHDRAIVVEVMGRSAGHLALNSGIAGGADAILIPEIPYSITNLSRHIDQLREEHERRFALIVASEGVKGAIDVPYASNDCAMGISQYIAEQVSQHTQGNMETRVTVLGHVQRGGLPSALDRIMGSALGKTAVDLVAQDCYDQMVAWREGEPIGVPLQSVVEQSPLSVNPHCELVQTARALGTYMGEVI
jgi:6-phosphofructokinase 1